MEALLILGALVALDLAAMRWGHDSRDLATSAEHAFARFGMSWDSAVPRLPKRVRGGASAPRVAKAA